MPFAELVMPGARSKAQLEEKWNDDFSMTKEIYFLAYGCANPFQPDMSDTHVRMIDFVQDFVYNFTDTVHYICEDGNVTFADRLYFFDDDMNRPNFTMTCQDNGNWTDYPDINCTKLTGTRSQSTV